MNQETGMKKNPLARLASVCFAVAAGTAITMSSAQAADDAVKIGFITDMSGLYADIDGQGGLEAVRMAVADFGGKVDGERRPGAGHGAPPGVGVGLLAVPAAGTVVEGAGSRSRQCGRRHDQLHQG